jgi:hypothetical protein
LVFLERLSGLGKRRFEKTQIHRRNRLIRCDMAPFLYKQANNDALRVYLMSTVRLASTVPVAVTAEADCPPVPAR